MKLARAGLALCAALAVSVGAAEAAEPSALTPKLPCAKMQGYKVPAAKIRLKTRGATITSAVLIPAAGEAGSPNYLPEYCEIKGEITSVDPAAQPILFGVAIPTAWRQKTMHIAGNGMLGFVPWLAALNRNGAGSPGGPAYPADAPYPLALGYATYGNDSGHKTGAGTAPGAPGGPPPVAPAQATQGGAGAAPPNYDWAANREMWLNFTYEHIRKGHDATMAIIAAMYGAQPKVRLYTGESHGGRQALEAIARYPEDYDGALVSVPLAYLTELWRYDNRNLRAQLEPGAWIAPAKRVAIEAETTRQCDELDGLKDGVINNYAGCAKAFDPAVHPKALDAIRCAEGADLGDFCLSDKQIATLNTIRSPVALGYDLPGHGSTYPGAPIGSEATSNYLLQRTQPDPANLAAGFTPLFKTLFNDLSVTQANLGSEKYNAQFQKVSQELDPPTDWSRFFAKGGKLIYHSASNDYTTNANGHIAAFEAGMKQSGPNAAKYARFYMTPQGDHGSRSYSFPAKASSPRHMNLVKVLTDWVEDGVEPPEAVRQTLTDTAAPYAVSASRPLCQYPKYPRYKGSGDPKAMESYACTAP